MKLFRDERGQTTIILGLCILSVAGMAGFAVDVGTMFRAKRVLQTAADAGAIAGTAEYNWTDPVAAAKAAAAQNGVTDGSNGYTVTVNSPPLSGPHAGTLGYIEVIASEAAPTYFMKLFNLTSMTVSARAVGGLGPASGCIYTLDTSGTDIGMTGTSDLSMPDCGIVVNSGSSDAIDLVGGATILADSVGVVGGVSGSAAANITPTPVTGVAPAYNPLAWITPPTFNASSCVADPHITGSGNQTIGPTVSGGTICYNGLTVKGSGNTTLTPGLYIINGGFSQGGTATITGSNVTFYLAPPNGSLSLTGGGALNVSAPTSGTWNGILFYQDATDTNAMSVTGSNGSSLEGIFYAPSASLSLKGSSTGTIAADLVVSSLSMVGTSNFTNYSSVNPSEPLTSSTLVE